MISLAGSKLVTYPILLGPKVMPIDLFNQLTHKFLYTFSSDLIQNTKNRNYVHHKTPLPIQERLRISDLLSVPPSDGPNSAYLVIQDDESIPTTFFGLLKDKDVQDLPFPQNRLLEFTHGTRKHRHHYPVYLIPVINKPLSSNTYFAIKPKGSHKGEGYACSREEDMTACCFSNMINDVKPRPFNPSDIYQHFNFSTKKTWGNLYFSATSVASDGFPPWFLRSATGTIRTQRPKHFLLSEAAGLDLRLRAQLPDFSFPSSQQTSAPVVVGKWYCPFMFVRDMTLKDQVKKSMFYEMTLEQSWERIFECEGENVVMVDTIVPTESARVGGESCERVYEGAYGENKNMVLFKSIGGTGREKPSSGMSSLIYERMIWEEERVGWVTNKDQQMKVVRKEECDRKLSRWARFSSYMLVERFVFNRSDGSIVLTYDFNHTHQIRSKWE